MAVVTPYAYQPRPTNPELVDRRRKRLSTDTNGDTLYKSNKFQPKELPYKPRKEKPIMPKITASTTELVQTRTGRERKPNPYITDMQGYADGRTYTIVCEANENPSTELVKLREAAGTIGKSVRADLVKDPATGTWVKTFRFKLVDKITRERKPKESAAPAAPTTKGKGKK